MPDLAEDPRPALRGAADHDRVGSRPCQHALRLLGRRDVAVRDHRNADRGLDRADRVVFDGSDKGAGARAAVHGERADAGALGDARYRERVPVLRVGAGADLERDGHVDRAHHRGDDRLDQRFVGEQRGSCGSIADLLRRAAHVDVDDLRAALDVVARGIGHRARVGARDLHGDRRHLAAMIGAPLRLRRAPQARIGRDHLRHRVARAQPLAQLAKRPVGDARHRRDDEIVGEGVRTDAHGRKWRNRAGNCSEGSGL